MRHVVVFLLWLSAGVSALVAQPFRVATWQVENWPLLPAAGAPPSANASADEAWFNQVGAILSAADADVIILYGIPDGEVSKKIASLLQPRKYSVALHTAFRVHGPKGPVVGQPFALITRKERLSSRSIEWGATGRIDLPGGFAVAAFRHGAGLVTLYVSIMPGSLTNITNAAAGSYYVRKREYAGQYLAHHASWIATTYTNALVATYLTGDFPLTPRAPVPDQCGKIFEQAGFHALSPGPAEDKTAHGVTNALHLDRVLDPIFTKGVEFAASRLIPRPAPEHPLIVCELTLKSPAAASARKPAGKPASILAAAKPAPAPAPLVPAAAPAFDPQVLPVPAPTAPLPQPEPAAVTTLAAPDVHEAAPTPHPALGLADIGTAASGASFTAAPAARPSAPLTWRWPRGGNALFLALVPASLLTLLVILRPWRSRRPSLAPVSRAAPDPAMFLELQPPAAAAPPPGPTSRPAVVLAPAPTATGNAHDSLRQRGDEEDPRDRSAEHLRRMLTPELRRIIREKLIRWLSEQRTHLLKSHETGTQQVLSLQARLDGIRSQFQERLLTQQERIAELDHALKAKETIIRDLLRGRPTER